MAALTRTVDGDGELRSDAATARATATEVGFPPDFFPSWNRFLRFSSNLQNGCMKIVFGFFFVIY